MTILTCTGCNAEIDQETADLGICPYCSEFLDDFTAHVEELTLEDISTMPIDVLVVKLGGNLAPTETENNPFTTAQPVSPWGNSQDITYIQNPDTGGYDYEIEPQ